MITLWSQILHSTTYGLVLSALLIILLLITQSINPEIMLNDYPPDIRKQYGQPQPKTRRQKLVASILFLSVIAAVLICSFKDLPRPVDFGRAFLNIFVVFMTFNIVDLLIIDWLIFVWLQPRFVILTGTEGMAGYRDYRFHFRGFLIGTVMITILSAVIAGFMSLFN